MGCKYSHIVKKQSSAESSDLTPVTVTDFWGARERLFGYRHGLNIDDLMVMQCGGNKFKMNNHKLTLSYYKFTVKCEARTYTTVSNDVYIYSSKYNMYIGLLNKLAV